MEEECIEPRSAAVVYSFSSWKDDMEDPIEDIDFGGFIKEHNLFSPITHIRFHRDCRDKIPPTLASRDRCSSTPDPKRLMQRGCTGKVRLVYGVV